MSPRTTILAAPLLGPLGIFTHVTPMPTVSEVLNFRTSATHIQYYSIRTKQILLKEK